MYGRLLKLNRYIGSTGRFITMEKSASSNSLPNQKHVYVPATRGKRDYGFSEISRGPRASYRGLFTESRTFSSRNGYGSDRSLRTGGEGRKMSFVPLNRNPRIEAELYNRSNSGGGINFDLYDNIPVKVDGPQSTACMESFHSLDFGELINKNIELCGFDKPTPIQKHGIPVLLNGQDLMACAQTGSGKTAAFLLPVVCSLFKQKVEAMERGDFYRNDHEPCALVLAPTRELAQQIMLDARRLTYRTMLKTAAIYGGASQRQQIEAIDRGVDILVATPGRLIDFLSQGHFNLSQCRFLVLDEADRMLDMGFEPQIRRVLTVSKMPPVGTRQTVMFSATFPPKIQDLARDFLRDEVFITVGRIGATSDNITQKVIWVSEEDKVRKLLSIVYELRASEQDCRILVFGERKTQVDRLEIDLYKEGHKVVSIHGDRTQGEREEALSLFRDKIAYIMVATDVAQRGLDIPNVTHVINFNFPSDIEDYVHRIGRTGRAGNVGTAITFFNQNNASLSYSLQKVLIESKQEVPEFLKRASSESVFSRDSHNRNSNTYRFMPRTNHKFDRKKAPSNGFDRKPVRDYWEDSNVL